LTHFRGDLNVVEGGNRDGKFRQQIIELVRAGSTPAELSREFGVTAQTIANWVGQAAIDQGKPPRGKEGTLSSAEREELSRLRRENRRLQTERDILAKATAWFAARGEKTSTPSSNS
jgi:transposase